MIFRAAPIALALLTTGCGDAPAQPREQAAAQPEPGYGVLPGSEAADVLKQCSRGAPAAGQSTWRPSAADIAAMEIAVGRALRAEPRKPEKADQWPRTWGRQYIGLVRDGRRYVYGNFFPQAQPHDMSSETTAVVVCDGGSSFFGAEYEPASDRITRIDFNGPY